MIIEDKPTKTRLNLQNVLKTSCVIALISMLAGCKTSGVNLALQKAEVNHETKFSSAAYGVDASPRLTTSKTVKKGGGRSMVGKPYKIKGKWYYPKLEPNYDKTGLASWYGPNFHGRLTANGEIYDQYHLSAAHPTFPLPSYARVINQENGRSVIVRVNDRGPFAPGRIIDLSSKAADMLGTKQQGLAKVRVQYIGEAPLHGQDMAYLVASYNDGSMKLPGQRAIQMAMGKIARPATPKSPALAKRVAVPVAVPRDILTLIGGKNVYIPSGDITGDVQQTAALKDTPAPKTAQRVAQLNTKRFEQSVDDKPTILAVKLEDKATDQPLKPRLTAEMLKRFHLRAQKQ